MVVSAARIELSDISSAAEPVSSSAPDQSELAAALAAVVAYIDAEDASIAELSRGSTGTACSGWLQALLREGVGNASVRTSQSQCKLSTWQSAFLFKSLSLLLLCSFYSYTNAILPARAADASTEVASDDSERDLAADAKTFSSGGQKTSAADSNQMILRPLPAYSSVPPAASSRSGYRRPYAAVSPAKGYPFYNGVTAGSRGVAPSPPATVDAPATNDFANGATASGPANTPGRYSGNYSANNSGSFSGTRYDTSSMTGDSSPGLQPYEVRTAASSEQGANGSMSVSTSAPMPSQGLSGQAGPSFAAAPAPSSGQAAALTMQPAQSQNDPELAALMRASGQINSSLMPADCIRIGLYFGLDHLDLAAIDGAQIRDASSGALVARLGNCSKWQIALQSGRQGAQLALFHKPGIDLAAPSDGSDTIASGSLSGRGHLRPVAYFPGAAAVPSVNAMRFPFKISEAQGQGSGYVILPKQDQVVALNGKLYRGAVWLKPAPKLINPNWKATDSRPQYRASSFDVINLVNIEDYLLSVVPSEMPSGWPLEALKAQAIAARSYAVSNRGKHGADGYDLKGTIDDQVYSGVSTESENSNRAVAETAGLVLKFQGKPVTAFFHSTSGGATELAEQVWGRPLPYLQAVPDFDDASPHFSWTRRLRVDDLESVIGQDIGRLLSLSVVSRSNSNRAQLLLAQGSGGSKLLSGENVRKLFKLPSTMFNIGSEDNVYIFAGRGFGHGLGMSQYGAKALAERGYNAAQIVSYYYKDVIVDYMAPAPGI